MQAHYQDSSLIGAVPSHIEGDQQKIGHFLYQGATILAILLFLISFWSC